MPVRQAFVNRCGAGTAASVTSPNMRSIRMIRIKTLLAHGARDFCAAPLARAAGEGAHRQFLQLVGLHRSDGAGRLHQGDRHQGEIRHLRLQRHAGDQAARRPHRLRSRRADRLFPRAPDQGRRVPEARQEQAAEPGQRLGRDRAAPCGLRSGQPVRRQLHVGHDRHRLQRQEGARGSGRGREDRQLGRRVQAGDASRSSRTAACMCSIPPTTSSRRRSPISSSIRTPRSRRIWRRPRTS